MRWDVSADTSRPHLVAEVVVAVTTVHHNYYRICNNTHRHKRSELMFSYHELISAFTTHLPFEHLELWPFIGWYSETDGPCRAAG